MSVQRNFDYYRTGLGGAVVFRRQRGVTSIEYALLAALIALVIVTAVTNTGQTVGNFFNFVAAQVGAAISP